MNCSTPGFPVHGDSPGKNTGVGCHAILQGIFPTQESNPGLPHCRRILYYLSHQLLLLSCFSRVRLFVTPWTAACQSSLSMGILQARILEWVAMPSSRGIFQTQGSNPSLPHCRWILYHLRPQGSPKILDWVAYPFSRGSSQPRNQTRVSCIAGRFFTN